MQRSKSCGRSPAVEVQGRSTVVEVRRSKCCGRSAESMCRVEARFWSKHGFGRSPVSVEVRCTLGLSWSEWTQLTDGSCNFKRKRTDTMSNPLTFGVEMETVMGPVVDVRHFHCGKISGNGKYNNLAKILKQRTESRNLKIIGKLKKQREKDKV